MYVKVWNLLIYLPQSWQKYLWQTVTYLPAIRAFWFIIAFDLLEDRRTIDVIVSIFSPLF